MSHQPPASEGWPAVAMSGSATNSEMSAMPSERPGTVTAATVLALVVGGLGVLTGVAITIAGLRRTLEHLDLSFDPRLEIGVLLIGVTTGSALFAVFALKGRPGGWYGAIVFQGTVVAAGATYLADTLINIPFGGLGRYRGYSELVTVIYVVLGAIAATSIGLLAGGRAARWFGQARRNLSTEELTRSPVRPARLTTAMIFLILTVVIEVVVETIYAIDVATGGPYEYSTTAGILVPRLVTEAIPLFLLVCGIIGIAVGNRLARVGAFAACGYYCFEGATMLFRLPATVSMLEFLEWTQLVMIIATLATAITSMVGLFTLSRFGCAAGFRRCRRR